MKEETRTVFMIESEPMKELMEETWIGMSNELVNGMELMKRSGNEI